VLEPIGRLVVKYRLRSNREILTVSLGRRRGQDGSAPVPAHSALRHGVNDDSCFRVHGNRIVTRGSRGRNPEREPNVALVAACATILLACAGCDRGGSSSTDHNSPAPSMTLPTAAIFTTSDPLTRAEADLRQVQATYYAAYIAAVAKPGDKSAVDRLLNVYSSGSPGARDIEARMEGLAHKGYAAKAGPKGYFVVQDVDVSSVVEGASARLTVCAYYDGVTYDTKHDGPDGKPITISDTAESSQTRFRYVHEGGSWRLVGGDVLKSWTGENRCPPKA
jgi:hypothetical protein